MQVGPLAREQAAAYRAMMLAAYAANQDIFTSMPGERDGLPLSWWEARLGDPATSKEVVIGASEDGQLLGAAGLAFETRPKLVHKATLFGMIVVPAARKRGLGRQIVSAALALARARGLRMVQLTVTDGNVNAEALYRACGFVEYGREPFAVASTVPGQFDAKIHMWCDLFLGERA